VTDYQRHTKGHINGVFLYNKNNTLQNAEILRLPYRPPTLFCNFLLESIYKRPDNGPFVSQKPTNNLPIIITLPPPANRSNKPVSQVQESTGLPGIITQGQPTLRGCRILHQISKGIDGARE
jgi:hypothetical protein